MTQSRDGFGFAASPGQGPCPRPQRIEISRWWRLAGVLLGAVGLLLALTSCGRQPEGREGSTGQAGAQDEASNPAADSLLGDQGDPGAMRDSGNVVQVALQPDRLRVKPGQDVVLLIGLDIDKPWHLYAHEDTAFYGVDLAPAEDLPLSGLQVNYPAGERSLFFGQEVLVLAGQQAIHVAGRVPQDLAPGTHPLIFELAVQACDDRRCLAPAFLPVRGELEVLTAPSAR
jgi:hypothetical protein